MFLVGPYHREYLHFLYEHLRHWAYRRVKSYLLSLRGFLSCCYMVPQGLAWAELMTLMAIAIVSFPSSFVDPRHQPEAGKTSWLDSSCSSWGFARSLLHSLCLNPILCPFHCVLLVPMSMRFRCLESCLDCGFHICWKFSTKIPIKGDYQLAWLRELTWTVEVNRVPFALYQLR